MFVWNNYDLLSRLIGLHPITIAMRVGASVLSQQQTSVLSQQLGGHVRGGLNPGMSCKKYSAELLVHATNHFCRTRIVLELAACV